MIAWRAYRMPLEGIARGYLNTGFYILDALRRATEVELTAGDVTKSMHVLHVCPPQFLKPVLGRVNSLFSMWESDRIPPNELDRFRLADRLIVPSKHNSEVLAAYGMKSSVVNLGVHPAFLQIPDREGWHAGQELAFLSLGAANQRKGTHLLLPAWKESWAKRRPSYDPFLYVKTIRDPPEVRAFCGGRAVIDTRDLDPKALLELYARSDVFLFPSVGEGFGLPALEAMAAGCLVVSTDSTGLAEFVTSENAIVVQRSMTATANYGVDIDVQVPTVSDLADALVWLYDHLGTIELESLKIAGRQTAARMTWDHTAKNLLSLFPTLFAG